MKKIVFIISLFIILIASKLFLSCSDKCESYKYRWNGISVYNIKKDDPKNQLIDTCNIDQYRIDIVLNYSLYTSLFDDLGFSTCKAGIMDCCVDYMLDTLDFIKKINVTTNDSIDKNHPKNTQINDILLSSPFISLLDLNPDSIDQSIKWMNKKIDNSLNCFLYLKFKPIAIQKGWYSFNVKLVLENGNEYSNSTNRIYLK